MADELKARLSVDTSSFKAGMADAASSMRSVSQVSGELKSALKDLADAELQVGKAAVQGNTQAAEIIEEYRGKVAQLTEELDGLKASTSAAADSTVRAAVATGESAATIDRETVSLQRNITARMAATAEIGLAEGRTLSLNRAAAAYLTTLPGIATAAQAAFAIAGPIAVIAVLAQLVHAIDGVIDDYKSLSAAARQADIDQAAAAAHGIVTVPAKVGISERIARFAKSLTGNADAPDAIQSSGGSDETVRTAAGVERLNAAQTQVLLSQNRLNEAGLKGSALAKQKQKDMQAEIDLLYKQSNALGDVLYSSQQLIRNQESTQDQVKFAQQQITAATEARDQINTRIQVLGNNKQAEAKIENTDDGSKLARAQMEEAEKRFAELNTKLPEEAIAFWRQYVTLFQREGANASNEYTQALEKLNHFTDEFEKDLSKRSEVVKKYQEEQVKLANLAPPEKTPVFQKNDEGAENELARESERGAVQAAELTVQLDKQATAFALAAGEIRPLAAAQRNAADDAALLAAKIKAINEQIEAFKKNSTSWNEALGRFTDNKEQAQFLGLQSQKSQLQGQGQLQANANVNAEAKQMAQPYIKAADTIENAFFKAFTQVAMRQKSWQQAMAQTVVSLELSAAQAVEKWILKWTEGEALVLAKHQLTNEAKIASDAATGAAQTTITATTTAAQGAIQATAGMKEALLDAKNAAVKGWKAGMSLPFPEDLVMAPVLAAAGFAGAMAQFDVGTPYVPKTGVAMIHRGEQIVTESNNRELMDFVRSSPPSRSSTSSVRATINNHYNNPGRPPSPREQAAAVRDLVKRGHRV